jgi:hypothetical protein
MRSISYITLIIGLACLGLAGCAETPIAKTNCWASAGAKITPSSKGALPDPGHVSPAVSSATDDTFCE